MRMLSFTPLAVSAVLAAMTLSPQSTIQGGEKNQDIVDTAIAAGSFQTLAAALQAADLVEALRGEGPFTVFAPTDDAFAKLPKGTVENLLKPENKQQLIGVLTYHVVVGNVPAKEVVSRSGAKTLNGQRVSFTVKGSSVSVNSAQVVKADIGTSNGTIHVIDRVLLPKSDNIPATAKAAGNFKTLLAAAEAAGLVSALSGEGPLTVFAPTDEAFAQLPAGTVESLLKPENKSKLASILKYHVIPGRVYADEALQAKSATTLLGESVSISADGSGARVNKSNLIATDIDASNGVIHVIDAVLLPPEKSISAAEARRMIERTVSRGVHLYNSGHHAACADLYAKAMQKMVTYGDKMPELVMSDLENTLSHAKRTHSATQRAWNLRHCIDRTYFTMRQLEGH